MPTSAASCATAPRIRSTSAISTASASGSVSGVMLRLVEPRLQDDLRRELVAQPAIRAAATPALRQLPARDFARPALVDQRDGQPMAPLELAGEGARAGAPRTLGAVGGSRDPAEQVR